MVVDEDHLSKSGLEDRLKISLAWIFVDASALRPCNMTMTGLYLLLPLEAVPRHRLQPPREAHLVAVPQWVRSQPLLSCTLRARTRPNHLRDSDVTDEPLELLQDS